MSLNSRFLPTKFLHNLRPGKNLIKNWLKTQIGLTRLVELYSNSTSERTFKFFSFKNILFRSQQPFPSRHGKGSNLSRHQILDSSNCGAVAQSIEHSSKGLGLVQLCWCRFQSRSQNKAVGYINTSSAICEHWYKLECSRKCWITVKECLPCPDEGGINI